MKKFNRVFIIVTDSLGIGDDGRQVEFADQGANTFKNTCKNYECNIPTWKKLGITLACPLKNFKLKNPPKAYIGKIKIASNAKDTLAGHWEMMGIKTEKQSPLFLESGFPAKLISQLEAAWDNRKIIGNKNASGTEILNELGKISIKTGNIIVYTSPDSTLQICGDEKTLGLEKLYQYAKIARKICSANPAWNVARVIARPFVYENNKFIRTFNRHDYANPVPKNFLHLLAEKQVNIVAIGKIADIFTDQKFDQIFGPADDNTNMDRTIEIASQNTKNQVIFVNLVEFDSVYGHRRNPDGYARNMSNFDLKLTKLIYTLKQNDLLIITSDHGNDPTFRGVDHTRELVPVTIYSKSFTKPKFLGNLTGLATVGNILLTNWNILPKNNDCDDIFHLLI